MFFKRNQEAPTDLQPVVRKLQIENEEQRRVIVERAKQIAKSQNRKPRVTFRDITLPLDLIGIPEKWSYPRLDKLDACMAFYTEHGVLDRQIIVNGNGTLLDGYIGYLTLRANGIESAKVLKIDWRLS